MKPIFALALIFIFTDFSNGQINKSKGNTFNPDVSANMLFLYRNGSRGNDPFDANDPTKREPNGYSLQEAELQFTSDVDVYARATALFAISQDLTTGKYGIEPEEVYAESLNLPYVTARVGKFKAALGKYNTYHTHGLPFIDGALINSKLLGDEGVNDVGIGVSGLLPTSWFSELTVQSIGAKSAAFGDTSPNAFVTISRYRNLWDLTDDLTADLGLSFGEGPNDVNRHTQIWGSDLTFKWRPSSGGRYAALIWSTEYLNGFKQLGREGEIKTLGGATFIQWQFAERWWTQGRAEYFEQRNSTIGDLDSRTKQSALLAFVPTEFTAVRAQYDHVEDRTGLPPENKVTLQLNMSIGAHPAHSY